MILILDNGIIYLKNQPKPSGKTGTPVMGSKPDILRAIVIIFAVGLVITGFTSIQASEDKGASAVAPPAADIARSGD